jgi:hypothetical protein
MLRNQFSNGDFVEQGKRLQFSAGLRPTFFGFFPGFGPLARIRHSFSPLIDYRFAPAATVSGAYARALDPTGTLLNSRTDPQQTIAIGLSQNFEGKLRASPKDTSQQQAQARKVRLLSINTDAVAYNFEQAKQAGHTGWQTQTVGNTFASDLVPNFSLRIVHDLWDGVVGFDSSAFSPFLTNLNASFAVTPGTLHGLAHLFGFGHAPAEPPKAVPPPAGQPAVAPGAPGAPGAPLGPVIGPPQFGGPTSNFVPQGTGAGQSFSLTATYSVTRVRPPRGVDSLSALLNTPQAGQQVLNLNLSFKPTDKWMASWTTVYDLVTHQFGEHYLRLERDLHRWHASFAFVKSPNGNFAFTFYVNLLDEPDIKFNYEQQTLPVVP